MAQGASKPRPSLSNRLNLAAAAGIVVLAAGLRLWRLDLTPFGIDEAALARLAEDMVRFGRVPLVGPLTSVGIPSAPHFIYLLAPVVALSRDPAVIAGGIGLANIAAVAVTVWVGWHWFGAPAGLIAALLFATNPEGVAAGRWIWQPNLLPPLAVLLLIALDRGVVEKRPWWAAASMPILVFGVLVHPAFAVLAPLLIAPIARLIAARRVLPLALSVGVSALIPLPFVLHEMQARFVDVANYRYYASLRTFVDFDAVRYSLAAATDLGRSHEPGVPPLDHAAPAWLVQSSGVVETVLLLSAIVVVVGAFVRTRGLTREWRMRLGGLLLWSALPVALNVRHMFPLQVHYFLVLYPATFLLVGVSFVLLPRTLRPVWLVGVAAVALVQASAMFATVVHLSKGNDVCYGPSLQTSTGLTDKVVLAADQVDSPHASVELNTEEAVPVAYLVRGLLPQVDLVGAGQVGLGNAPVRTVNTTATSLTGTGPPDLRYDNGVSVSRSWFATQADADQRVHLAIAWTLGAQTPPQRPLVWDVALRDADDAVVFSRSGIDHLPGSTSQASIVSWFFIDAPAENDAPLTPGQYTVTVQLVDAFDSKPLSFTDAHSNSDTRWTVGPISVTDRQRCS